MVDSIFLTATWRFLLMANYEVAADFIEPYLPKGTELDTFEGRTLISLVGFWFADTKVLGLPIPFHRQFPEVNLRIYVKRKEKGEWRRGVVFIKELVPRFLVAWVAKKFYEEPYQSLRMDFHIPQNESIDVTPKWVRYAFQVEKQWNQFQAKIQGQPQPCQEGSEQQFITEHYFGYNKNKQGETMEYKVAHPPWKIWPVTDFQLSLPTATTLYPAWTQSVFTQDPSTVFVADGSAVIISHGKKMILS